MGGLAQIRWGVRRRSDEGLAQIRLGVWSRSDGGFCADPMMGSLRRSDGGFGSDPMGGLAHIRWGVLYKSDDGEFGTSLGADLVGGVDVCGGWCACDRMAVVLVTRCTSSGFLARRRRDSGRGERLLEPIDYGAHGGRCPFSSLIMLEPNLPVTCDHEGPRMIGRVVGSSDWLDFLGFFLDFTDVLINGDGPCFVNGKTFIFLRSLATCCGRPSNSDFNILRSSINRMGEKGGVSHNGTPRTCFRPGRTFERVTTPVSDSPFDESQPPDTFHQTTGDFFQ